MWPAEVSFGCFLFNEKSGTLCLICDLLFFFLLFLSLLCIDFELPFGLVKPAW
jgi:hypothetical protein